MIIPCTVIPEVCYLINTYLGRKAELTFIRSLINRELTIEHFNEKDLIRCAEILEKYQELNIGFIDATVIAIAERLNIKKILTTDRRHFSAVKPRHCDFFTFLP